MEGSFADGANNHGFKRSRWRQLWRQQIQDFMIAAVWNVKTLIIKARAPAPAVELGALAHSTKSFDSPLPGVQPVGSVIWACGVLLRARMTWIWQSRSCCACTV